MVTHLMDGLAELLDLMGPRVDRKPPRTGRGRPNTPKGRQRHNEDESEFLTPLAPDAVPKPLAPLQAEIERMRAVALARGYLIEVTQETESEAIVETGLGHRFRVKVGSDGTTQIEPLS